MQQYKEDISLAKYLFHLGKNYESYNFFGSHQKEDGTKKGFIFRVWAPHAVTVSVVGDFNQWNHEIHVMEKLTDEGIWELFIEGLDEFSLYKYAITTKDGRVLYKSDPYAFHGETDVNTASFTYSFDQKFNWTDDDWTAYKATLNIYESPMNIYEVHLGSWRRYQNGKYFDYKKLALELISTAIE